MTKQRLKCDGCGNDFSPKDNKSSLCKCKDCEKRCRERNYFEEFKKCYSNLPDGKIKYTDKPDVILKTDTDIIGIEITNLYHKDGKDYKSEQIQRGLRSKVIERAQELYVGAGHRRIHLRVKFNSEFPITKDKVKAIAKFLAEFAGEIQKDNDSGKFYTDNYNFQNATFPELEFVRLNLKDRDEWTLFNIYQIPTLRDKQLQKIVTEKENKLKDYNEDCNIHWLLVVVDSFDFAQDQIICQPHNLIHSTKFEKIFIFKPGCQGMREKLVELVLVPK